MQIPQVKSMTNILLDITNYTQLIEELLHQERLNSKQIKERCFNTVCQRKEKLHMTIVEEKLRRDALELDSLLVAFEDRYLHFVDFYDEKQTPKEVEERDRACVAFYRIRDMISELALKSTELADMMLAEGKAAKHQRQGKEDFAKAEIMSRKPEKNGSSFSSPYSTEENKLSCVAKVVSTLGVVKIVNTDNGKMYSPSDIAEVCGIKCGQKWVERNLIKGKRTGVKVVAINVRDRAKTGRQIGYLANFVSRNDAEKIMVMLNCPQDIAEWIRNTIFGYKFHPDSVKIDSSEFMTKNEKEKEIASSSQNNITYRNGELKVSWT